MVVELTEKGQKYAERLLAQDLEPNSQKSIELLILVGINAAGELDINKLIQQSGGTHA